jgi:hypothetical protein
MSTSPRWLVAGCSRQIGSLWRVRVVVVARLHTIQVQEGGYQGHHSEGQKQGRRVAVLVLGTLAHHVSHRHPSGAVAWAWIRICRSVYRMSYAMGYLLSSPQLQLELA